MLTALLPSFELMDAISSIQSKIIWHFLFPRALSWTGHQPGYMATADGGYGGWWLTVQGQGDKQALSSVPAIDFCSEVSASDMAAVRVDQPPKLELASYKHEKGRCRKRHMIIMASQNQGYDTCTANSWYHAHRKQCRMHRGILVFYPQIYFDCLNPPPVVTYHDERTFIILL